MTTNPIRLHVKALLLLMAFSWGFPSNSSKAQEAEVSFQVFYDQLSDQGQWIETDNYGYCWQPTVDDPNWQPYSIGHWVLSDCGWTWVSEEPWGWATYHYGRWVNLEDLGWVWVPGYRWAPAWVSWRHGGGILRMVPLPPESFIGAEYSGGGFSLSVGFSIGSNCDRDYHIGPACYNFVPTNCLGERNYRPYYVERSRNFTVINRTTNVTHITINKTVVNNYYNPGQTSGNRGGRSFRSITVGGPPIQEVNATARTPMQRYSLVANNQAGHTQIEGKTLSIYAPRFNPSTAQTARPARVEGTVKPRPKVNRGDDITRPLVVRPGVRPGNPSPEAVRLAKESQAAAPREARIPRVDAPLERPLRRPLTEMRPIKDPTPPQLPLSRPVPPSTKVKAINPAVISDQVVERPRPQALPPRPTPPQAKPVNQIVPTAVPKPKEHHEEHPRPSETRPAPSAKLAPPVNNQPPGVKPHEHHPGDHKPT